MYFENRYNHDIVPMFEPFKGKVVAIDVGCRNLISALWRKGIETEYCCSGHYHIYRNPDGRLISGWDHPYIKFTVYGGDRSLTRALIKFMRDKGYENKYSILQKHDESVHGRKHGEPHGRYDSEHPDDLFESDQFPRFEADITEFLNTIR